MDIAIHGGFDARMAEQPLQDYPCRILCLFDFCPFNELLSVEPETRVHHDTLLYHNFASFSISFGFFVRTKIGGFQHQIATRPSINSSNALRFSTFEAKSTIDLSKADHVILPDGTKLMVPEA